MRRRSAGEGSIFKSTRQLEGGPDLVRYVAQLSTGPRRHRRLLTRTCRTRSEAGAALVALRAEAHLDRQWSRLDLGSYLHWFVDEIARPTVSANTVRGYDDIVGHFAVIGHIALEDLTAEDIERACGGMMARKGTHTAPASAKTVRNCQTFLRRVLQLAVDRGHVARNVAKTVPLRRVPRYDVEAITPDRARQILAAIKGDRLEAAYALGFVGLRSSEILGLARSDVDLTAGALTIRHQISGSGPRAILVQTKTAASAATVPLPEFALSRLQAHLARSDAERPVVPIGGDSLIFVTESGFGVNGTWFAKHFQSILQSHGLPRMRVHDLRHAAASLLVGAGAHPRIAQELLRHAPGSRITMERYAHVTALQQREAADLLDRAIGG